METSIVSREDMTYLAQQSAGKLNMILSGMTALLNDNENKVNMMESQTWFQRMARTITGKNKMTQQEIQRNHDKINLYLSQAMTALYEQNCIDHQVMMSLGNQINSLYTEHLQLKQMLGAFASKLNQKIESIDNFHILVTEIEQGVYSDSSAIVSICKILSQLDKRTVQDDRKLEILYRAMQNQGILSEDKNALREYLLQFTSIALDDIGSIYLELETIRDNYMAGLILKLIEGYHFLPDMARMLKNKESVIDEIIEAENLDAGIELSLENIYRDLVNSKSDMLNNQLPVEKIQESNMLKEAEEDFFAGRFDEAFKVFENLAEQGNGRAMYMLGDYYNYGVGSVCENEEDAKAWYIKSFQNGEVLGKYREIDLSNEEKEEKYNRYKELYKEILELAENGDILAQTILGMMLRYGEGVENCEENEKKGAEYYLQAAQSGYFLAERELVTCYTKGCGVKKDYKEAFEWAKKAVSKKCAYCYQQLATEYYYGRIMEEDEEKALIWYKKAAELGNANAQFAVGNAYENGWGGAAKSMKEAVLWYKKAAEAGEAGAQWNLGWSYENGEGVEKDKREAVKWYKKAAEQGNRNAQNALGWCYANGEGIEKDEKAAVKWYKKAAEQGNRSAQWNLGLCYEDGDGVEKDESEAVKWYKKAAEQGHEKAVKYLKEKYNIYI